MIFAATGRSQMECYRRSAKDRYGDSYQTKIAPFVSLIVLQFVRYKGMGLEKSIDEVTRDLVAIVRGKMRQDGREPNPHLFAAIYSAGLEVEERRLHEIMKRPTPVEPPADYDDAA